MDLNRIKKRSIFVIAIAVFLVCLVYLFKEFNWQQAIRLVSQAQLLLFFAGATLSIVFYWFIRALRWWVMLSVLGYKGISFLSLYIATAYSLGLSMLMPLQSGEILKVEMLKKKGEVTRSDGYFALAIERILDLIVVSLIALTCLSISSTSAENIVSATQFAGLVFLVLAVIGLFLFFFAGQVQIVKEIKSRIVLLSSEPSLMVCSLVFTILAWFCVSFGWWTTLASVEIYLETVDVIGLTTGMTLVNVLSFVPGSIGVSEVGISIWLSYLGIDLILANAGALMLRGYGLMLLVIGVLHWLIVRLFNSFAFND